MLSPRVATDPSSTSMSSPLASPTSCTGVSPKQLDEGQGEASPPELPPELWARVFSYLADRRTDVAACRLTCRAFYELSSPFLITRVVFAKRLETILRLCEVVEHPYFRQHVTELVYDASTYFDDRGNTFGEYLMTCQDIDHRTFHADALDAGESADECMWQLIASKLLRGVDCAATRSHSMHDEDHRSATGLDCYVSFPKYRRRVNDQSRIERTSLPSRMMQRVLALPKLRSVVFADYRALARDGETFDACCQRLFGNVLDPANLSRSDGKISRCSSQRSRPRQDPMWRLSRSAEAASTVPKDIVSAATPRRPL